MFNEPRIARDESPGWEVYGWRQDVGVRPLGSQTLVRRFSRAINYRSRKQVELHHPDMAEDGLIGLFGNNHHASSGISELANSK